MLRSSTRSPERNAAAAAIGPESCIGRRVASRGAGILLVHRGDRSLRPRGLQRLAPARPPARAVHHRGHQLRPALGALPPLPGGRGGHGQPARPLPLHDAVPPPRREPWCPSSSTLAKELAAKDRFFRARRALLSGPFPVVGRWAAPRVAVSPGGGPVPSRRRRPRRGGAGRRRRAAGGARTGSPAPGSSPTPSTIGPSRSPSSTAISGRPPTSIGTAGGGVARMGGPAGAS